jgi:hypothetical protein
MAEAGASESRGLDPEQWRTVFGLVLDELRKREPIGTSSGAVERSSRGGPAIGGTDGSQDVVDEAGEGRLVPEEGC